MRARNKSLTDRQVAQRKVLAEVYATRFASEPREALAQWFREYHIDRLASPSLIEREWDKSVEFEETEDLRAAAKRSGVTDEALGLPTYVVDPEIAALMEGL